MNEKLRTVLFKREKENKGQFIFSHLTNWLSILYLIILKFDVRPVYNKTFD